MSDTIVLVERSSSYLEHHGIKGQKWGVRNGPPYPLKSSDHSAAEKRAVGTKEVGVVADLIVPATYLAIFATAYAATCISAKKAVKRKTEQYKEEYYEKRKIKSLEECPKVDPKSMSMDEHMKCINPDYPGMGATNNCMFCTTAMALRMKGYDVSAEKCPDGWAAENIESSWNNFKDEEPKCKTTKELEKYLAAQGDGAYGNLLVYWSLGGGHSVFYQVENGEVKIYDTQANNQMSMRDFNGVILPKSSEVIRLDDKEPTEMVLGAVKPKKEKEKET